MIPDLGFFSVTVDIQTSTRSADGLGGFTDSWTTTESVEGVLRPLIGQESVKVVEVGAARKFANEIGYGKEVTLGFFKFFTNTKKSDNTTRTITEEQRIKFGTRIFDILFVNNQYETGQFYEIDLRELTNAGAT